MENIEKNLYQLYQYIATTKGVKYNCEEEYEVLMSEKYFWPQIIFNLNQFIAPEKLIPKIAIDIPKKKYTPFFIATDKHITRNHSAILKENGILPVKILRGMNLLPTKIKKTKLPHDFYICELCEYNQFVHFSNLVNLELMSSKIPFNPELLNNLIPGNEIKLYGLFNKQILVSSTLVFTNHLSAGLYFIVTKKEYQNKGYAFVLIQFILNKLFEHGIKEVVLHANNFAAGLYNKIGFTYQNNFVIYKKF